jgi:two-component system, OmpR family, phosphate regulon response regulator OmpR
VTIGGMNRPYQVHLVDVDTPARTALRSYLEANGLGVTPLGSAEELLRRMDRLRPDLVVLEMLLPGMGGLRACQQLRGAGDRVPLIFITSRGDEVDRVLGIEVGADDLLVKPVSPRELLARIHAVLRRTLVPPGLPMFAMQPVAIGRQSFDPTVRCLHHDGRQHMLSTVEFAVLAELVGSPGVAMSRERLLAASHSREGQTLQLRAIDVVVMRLRKRVEPDPAEPRFIQTIRGHGYMFVPGPDPDQRSRRSTPTGVLESPSMNRV